MKDTFDLIGNILALGEIEELPHDVECRGGCLDGKYGISQSLNGRGFIHQSTSESLFIELKGEIQASNL